MSGIRTGNCLSGLWDTIFDYRRLSRDSDGNKPVDGSGAGRKRTCNRYRIKVEANAGMLEENLKEKN
jgi:hypothetical protein